MNKKAFIFTMDAALALVPIFIVLASVSQIGGGYYQDRQARLYKIAHDSLTVLSEANAYGNNDMLEDFIINSNAASANKSLDRLISNSNYMLVLQNGTEEDYVAGRAGNAYTEASVRASLANATDVAAATELIYVAAEEISFNGTYEGCGNISWNPAPSGTMTICRYPLIAVTNETIEMEVTVSVDGDSAGVNITNFTDAYSSSGFSPQSYELTALETVIDNGQERSDSYSVTTPTTPGTYTVTSNVDYCTRKSGGGWRCGQQVGSPWNMYLNIDVRDREGVVGNHVFKMYVWENG